MTAYATEQGLGYLAKSFYDAGVIDEVILIHHGGRPTLPEWYDNKAIPIKRMPIRGPAVDAMLDRIDVMLFFETAFDWNFPKTCKAKGVRTVCMPMYEWFPKDKTDAFDGYLCPSLLDVDYFPGSPVFQPPVDPSIWRLRGKATRFLHNSGNVGCRGHKGTLELLKAAEFIESDLTLTIRTQDAREFGRALDQVPQVKKNPRVDLQIGAIPYEDLFVGHDVLVAPEKFNGLSLPLQEAYAAGMLVMTTNRYPINTWLPAEPLIPVESYHEAAIGGGYFSFQEATVSPRAIARTMDDWYGRDIATYSRKAHEWAMANSWDAKKEAFIKLMEDFAG
jgi:hypothetical protein